MQSDIDIQNATHEIDFNGPKWTIRQWVEDFIDIVYGLPLIENRHNPDWFSCSKEHPIAVLLELTDVEIKALKSLLVVRTNEVDRLMTDALLNRCRGCDFLRLKMEQEQN